MQRCRSNLAVKKGSNSMICAQLIIRSPEIVIKKILDGHQYFIGCSLWKRSDPMNSHRFMSLPTSTFQSPPQFLQDWQESCRNPEDSAKLCQLGRTGTEFSR